MKTHILKTNAERLQRVLWLGVACLGLAPSGPLSAQQPELRATLREHTLAVMSVTFSPDGKTLASGSCDKTIKLWDAAAGKEQATLKGHTDFVWSLAYCPDGKTLASVSKDTSIKLWNVATGKEQATLSGHTDWQCSIAFSPDGKTLAEGSKDRTIKLWDVRTAKVRATLKWHLDWLDELVAPLPKEEAAVAYSPDGKTLASENVDKTIHLWDVATGKVRTTFNEGLRGGSTCVAYSPDGKTLASTGGSGIVLWDLNTGKKPTRLGGNQVSSVAFSPDSQTLASGSQDGTITLWDVNTGKEQATLQGHRDAIWSVAYSPDGKTLASGSGDRTVKLWDMPAAKKTNKQASRSMETPSVTGTLNQTAGE